MKRLAAIFIAVVVTLAAGVAPPSSGARPDGAKPPGENYLGGQLLVASPSLKGRIQVRQQHFIGPGLLWFGVEFVDKTEARAVIIFYVGKER